MTPIMNLILTIILATIPVQNCHNFGEHAQLLRSTGFLAIIFDRVKILNCDLFHCILQRMTIK